MPLEYAVLIDNMESQRNLRVTEDETEQEIEPKGGDVCFYRILLP